MTTEKEGRVSYFNPETDRDKQIPTMHIKGKGVTDTYYRMLEKIEEESMKLRTQYDRKGNDGNFIDPPGKDVRALIEIEDLFAEPRFPRLSFCEVGKYIAEMVGAKNQLVVPYDELLEKISQSNEEFEATEWPYCYHQRLTAYPLGNGETFNQLEEVVNKLASGPLTRRAVAITGVPQIDLKMKSDAPCLRELQFRGIEYTEKNQIVLNTFARWRSRDSYKAWSDNLVGLRNLVQFEIAKPLAEKTGKEVIVGPYSEEAGSLHIYGQDYTEKGAGDFFKTNSSLESFIETSQMISDVMDDTVITQLEALRGESDWKFNDNSIRIIDNLIDAYKSGRCKP